MLNSTLKPPLKKKKVITKEVMVNHIIGLVIPYSLSLNDKWKHHLTLRIFKLQVFLGPGQAVRVLIFFYKLRFIEKRGS